MQHCSLSCAALFLILCSIVPYPVQHCSISCAALFPILCSIVPNSVQHCFLSFAALFPFLCSIVPKRMCRMFYIQSNMYILCCIATCLMYYSHINDRKRISLSCKMNALVKEFRAKITISVERAGVGPGKGWCRQKNLGSGSLAGKWSNKQYS